MNFEDIWQENKSFILSLVAGLVVFLTAYNIIAGSKEDEIAGNLRRISIAERNTKKLKLPSGELQKVERRTAEMRETISKLEKDLAFVPQPGFTLEGVTRSADIHFNEMVQKMLVDVVEPAASLDIRIPSDLGLGDVTPRTNEEREWYLNGLDVVHRICIAGMAGGVEAIEPIRIAKMPKKSRRDRNDETPYLRSLVVTFTARGTPMAIETMMRGLQIPGQRLVVDKAKIQSMDGLANKQKVFVDESLVVLDMTVSALLVDQDGAPQVATVSRM